LKEALRTAAWLKPSYIRTNADESVLLATKYSQVFVRLGLDTFFLGSYLRNSFIAVAYKTNKHTHTYIYEIHYII